MKVKGGLPGRRGDGRDDCREAGEMERMTTGFLLNVMTKPVIQALERQRQEDRASRCPMGE